MMTKQISKILSTFFILTKITDCYDGPVASIFHRYPGSDSFVNINFNEPGHSQVRFGIMDSISGQNWVLLGIDYIIHFLFVRI